MYSEEFQYIFLLISIKFKLVKYLLKCFHTYSRDRSNSNSRNRKDRSPSTGSSKDRGSNRPSPSNKESPNKDRRGSKLAQIYEDETQQVGTIDDEFGGQMQCF